MITPLQYETYFENLQDGKRSNCSSKISQLVEKQVPVEVIYEDLFKTSHYNIGELWEQNKISVASENMATALTETLMTQLYPIIFNSQRVGKKIIVACVANELHQVGAKMIADIFEMYGWDFYFIGASTPLEDLINFIENNKPDVLGLSLSIYFNMNILLDSYSKIRNKYPNLPIIIGGQAFRFGGSNLISGEKTFYIKSITDLKKLIETNL